MEKGTDGVGVGLEQDGAGISNGWAPVSIRGGELTAVATIAGGGGGEAGI